MYDRQTISCSESVVPSLASTVANCLYKDNSILSNTLFSFLSCCKYISANPAKLDCFAASYPIRSFISF